jgi:uncharacterized protein
MSFRSVFSVAVFLMVAGLLTWSVPAHAASFGCTKAGGDMEAMICGDPAVSALDGELDEAYKTALAAVGTSFTQDLIKEQHDWIHYTRALCRNADCLKQAYEARIVVLARNDKYISNETSCEAPDGRTACDTVVSYRDPSFRLASFNQTLAEQRKPGRIIGCTMLIDLPVGTAHGNDSFGGYCVLDEGAKRTEVKICNDEMIGHFALQTIDPTSESKKALIDFTADQCLGS